MNDLLPQGWSLKSCRELSHVITKGTTPSSLGFDFQDSGINFIKVESISSNGIIDAAKFSFINHEANLALKRSIICEGDILITIAGATVGKLAIVLDIHLPANTNQALAIIRANEGKVYRTYLLYWLQTNYIKRSIDAIKTVGAQPNLSLVQVGDFLVNLPPLSEQQKIAAILTSVDEVIEKTQAQIDKLKDLKTAMMQELLTKGIGHVEFKDSPVGSIPVGWEVEPLKNNSERVCVGFVGTCEKYYCDDGIPMVRTGNLKKGILDLSSVKYVTREFHELQKKSQLKEGDILIARHGNHGQACLVPASLKEANCLNVVIIKVDLAKYLPEFLKYVFNSDFMIHSFDAKSEGSTQKVISTTEIANTLFPKPSIKEQTTITNVLKAIDTKLNLTTDRIHLLNATKKALMQDLLTGKVRVKTEQPDTTLTAS